MGIDFLPRVNLSGFDFVDDLGTPKESEPSSHPNLNQNGSRDLAFEIAQKTRGSLGSPPDQLMFQGSIPHGFEFGKLPEEMRRSSTIENLISQNDDLMARLKVSHRRLALIENENKKVIEEARKIKNQYSSLNDQVYFSHEKENSLKKKTDVIEKEKQLALEKLRNFEIQNQMMRSESDRYRKYHEKIRTQVKPYISQLKDYSKSLENKLENLENAFNESEGKVRDLRQQIVHVTQNARDESTIYEHKIEDMIRYYEVQLESLRKQTAEQKEEIANLEPKANKLRAALERQDVLENENITLRRLKDDLKIRLEQENNELRARTQELIRHKTKSDLEIVSLREDNIEKEKLTGEQERKIEDMNHQLESLRFMWNAKNEENDKLRAAINSLERINVELSQQLGPEKR